MQGNDSMDLQLCFGSPDCTLHWAVLIRGNGQKSELLGVNGIYCTKKIVALQRVFKKAIRRISLPEKSSALFDTNEGKTYSIFGPT